MILSALNPQDFVNLYRQGKYDELSERFLAVLDFLDQDSFTVLSSDDNRLINDFTRAFLYLFTKNDYLISENYAIRFVYRSPVISNLVALTPNKTTDRQLEVLRNQDNSLVKILSLLSSRNGYVFNPASFFDSNPKLASIWYSSYYLSVTGSITERIYTNMNRHQESLDKRWAIMGASRIGGPAFPYFFSTYVNPESDKAIKQHINACIKPMFKNMTIRNIPNRKRVAILSARWGYNTAVYKSCFRFVEALRPDYDLTLIQFGAACYDFDKTLFSEIHTVTTAGGFEVLQQNDFMLAYFPDIGMHDEDRFISNLRFAPIQVTGYGHPVSTWGGEIDYFIGGRDVEIAELAEDHYSERLVLIPGIGAIPCHPNYQIKGVTRQDEKIIINCPWGADKYNYQHLLNLREIIERSHEKVLFRCFPACRLLMNNSFLPFLLEMQEMLGAEHVEVIPSQSYEHYMALMEQGDFSIDSWPFGGYNTIIDSLWIGKPVVCLEGTLFINRASSALLRQVGLDEMITHSKEEYVECILKLMHDGAWREQIIQHIKSIDLERTVFDSGYGQNFRIAIDYLIENHETLKKDTSRKPIVIE